MKHYSTVIALLFFFVITASQANSIVCPNGIQFVNIGDSLSQVLARCGKPSQMQQVPAVSKKFEVWDYDANSHSYNAGNPYRFRYDYHNRFNNINGPQNRIGHFTLIFNEKDQLIQLTSDGQTRYAMPCGTALIVKGSTMAAVRTQCGTPNRQRTVHRKPQTSIGQTRALNVHLIYQSKFYLPSKTFIFQQGRLVGVQ